MDNSEYNDMQQMYMLGDKDPLLQDEESQHEDSRNSNHQDELKIESGSLAGNTDNNNDKLESPKTNIACNDYMDIKRPIPNDEEQKPKRRRTRNVAKSEDKNESDKDILNIFNYSSLEEDSNPEQKLVIDEQMEVRVMQKIKYFNQQAIREARNETRELLKRKLMEVQRILDGAVDKQ